MTTVKAFKLLFILILTTSFTLLNSCLYSQETNIDSIRIWDDLQIISDLYSEKEYEKTLQVIDSLVSVDQNRAIFYAELQSNKAKSLIKLLRFDEADEAIRIAKKYWRNQTDSLVHEYATLIGYQGEIEEERGNYKLSEEYNLRAMEIIKNFHGIENEHYAVEAANLANSYQNYGNYKNQKNTFLSLYP